MVCAQETRQGQPWQPLTLVVQGTAALDCPSGVPSGVSDLFSAADWKQHVQVLHWLHGGCRAVGRSLLALLSLELWG